MTTPTPLRAGIGTHVDLELISEDGTVEVMALDLVADAAADIDAGLIGIGTPLASAIVGRAAGTVVPYRQGDIRQVRIVVLAPSAIEPDMEAAERRRAASEEALRKAERTSAEIFSTTFTSKWGGYDASQLED